MVSRILPPAPVEKRAPAAGDSTPAPAPLSRDFQPVPFWSWNEKMAGDEIRHQVDLIRQGGWGGAFVHARAGLTTPYLSQEWFTAVDATIDACQQSGLGVWLYDEDTWPSGFSGGRIPALGAAYRMKALVARPVDQSPPDHCHAIGQPAQGIQVYRWTAPMGNPWFHGACYADLLNPQTVERFLDDAYRSYHARYGRHYGRLITAQFTDEPSPIFRLGLPRGAVPFSPVVPSRFAEMHGYDPLPHLPKLFLQMAGAETFRIQYYRTISHLFEHHFARRLGRWCEQHGIALTGHFMAEHSLYDQLLWGAPVMPNYRHQAIPGIDHLARQVNELLTAKQCQSVVNQYGKRRMLSELYGVSGQGLTFADRWWIACQQIALGVNLLNPHLALYTMAGCRKRDYPPNLFYQQPWWPMNHVLDNALSRLCETMAEGEYEPEILVLHPGDTAAALWRGAIPETEQEGRREDLWDQQATDLPVKEQIDRYDSDLKHLLEALAGSQRQFDLGDETILSEDGSVQHDDGAPVLRVGRMSYRIVVIPSMFTIRGSTLKLLQQFRAAGGPVIRVGESPSRVNGMASPFPAQVLEGCPTAACEDLPAMLENHLPPIVRLTTPDGNEPNILAHVRRLGTDQRTIFLTNRSRLAGDRVTLLTPGAWTVRRLDPSTGEWHDMEASIIHDSTTVELSLPPAQATLLRLAQASIEQTLPTHDAPANPAPPAAQQQTELRIESVHRLDDNALTLDVAHWREGDSPWSPRPVPLIALQERLKELQYAGPLTLRFEFQVEDPPRIGPLKLVVEYPQNYTIHLNGHAVKHDGLPCWRDIRWLPIEVGRWLRPGLNTIQMHCARFHPARPDALDDPPARYGTELEAVYLVGDFSVSPAPLPAQPDCPRWREFALPDIQQSLLPPGPFTLTAPALLAPGDTTRQGLPFYAGRLSYRAHLDPSPHKRLLRVEHLDAAIAEVRLDDTVLGHLMTHPLQVPIPPGGGALTLTLFGTLRNLLGPHHHPEGELPVVSPPLFQPVLPAPIADSVLKWGHAQLVPGQWVDGYSLVSFGRLGRITLQELAE